MTPAVAGRTSVLDRFLHYVTYDTQADPESTSIPSTAKQLQLLDRLVEELKQLGIADAVRDEFGIVMATLPATPGRESRPVVGLLAHVDTSPEMSGADVRPIVHYNWDGRDIVLPDDPSAVLRPSEDRELAAKQGEDVITASGATLLGADDKSGVAVIMAAVEYLLAHPEIPHGPVRVSFTPDEEIGRGVKKFDVARFGAHCAYTLDGEGLGSLDVETFSADSMTVTFQGFNTHPGLATGKMVNAIKLAADFVSRLPRNGMAPETTGGRDGFVHPNVVDASVDRTSVRFIVRDFRTEGLKEKEEFLERLARETVAAWPGSSVTFEVRESYRNPRETLEKFPAIVDNAREAIRRVGLEPVETAIRGGTDGSLLTAMGLPTPNLFSGQHNFHSRLEWITAQDLERSVAMVVELLRVWDERG